MSSESFTFIGIYRVTVTQWKNDFFSLFLTIGQYKRNYTNRKTPQTTGNRSPRHLRLWQAASQGWKRSPGGSRTGVLGGLFAARASRRRWFRWVAASEPSPWRCRSPGRWPLCRFRSCRGGNRFRSKIGAHTRTTSAPVATLTSEGRIHFARRDGSVWRRRKRSTSDQNLASGVLWRPTIALARSTRSHTQNQRVKSDLWLIPGWWGMTSPVYSALPQELLLEAEPRRPVTKTPLLVDINR